MHQDHALLSQLSLLGSTRPYLIFFERSLFSLRLYISPLPLPNLLPHLLSSYSLDLYTYISPLVYRLLILTTTASHIAACPDQISYCQHLLTFVSSVHSLGLPPCFSLLYHNYSTKPPYITWHFAWCLMHKHSFP